MLEIGPGPGAATEWLRQRLRDLTVVDLDDEGGGEADRALRGQQRHVVIGSPPS